MAPPVPPVAPRFLSDARPRPAEPPPSKASLAAARALADAGHLAEAAQQCEACLRESGPSAEAFHLLGLLRDAAGNRLEAIAQYRKALYLDPHHQEALAHLALLLEQGGDGGAARMLRERMQRSVRRGDA